MSIEIIEEEGHAPVRMWLPEKHPVEAEALAQISRVASMPFTKAVAVMPDVHVGKGATVGSVIATMGAVIPAAVGVDIGCGMVAYSMGIKADALPDNLAEVRSTIERCVPHGRTNRGQEGDRGSWGDVPGVAMDLWAESLNPLYQDLLLKHPKIHHKRGVNQLGTLGGGNHFIELCIDESGGVWLMLHSGSRGVGNKIGSYFIELAKKDMETHFISVPDKDLSYLCEGTVWYDDYIDAVSWAQMYAMLNRELMLNRIIKGLGTLAVERKFPDFYMRAEAINCHHNYVTKEHHFGRNMLVTRKGAVEAREGTMGIIPGSMGAKSFIVRGKGNRLSLNSCSHGAGRIMSRTVAKTTFTLEDFEAQTKGVECRKDADLIDEIPGAYKDIDAVMAAQEDLVEIVHTLKQVVCVKG